MKPANREGRMSMNKDQNRQELDTSDSSQDRKGRHTEDEEYAYQESGIREREGSIPLWLILVTILLICWGVYYTIEYWSSPLPIN